jgi:hypothetical protein
MNVSTSFLNSKGRRIHQGERGGYFVKKADGTRVYGIKAAKRVAVGSGAKPRKLVKSNRLAVPSPIRPAVRKTRANKGVARGPQEGALQRRMNAEAARRAAAKARAMRRRKALANLKNMANKNPYSALRRKPVAAAMKKKKPVAAAKKSAAAMKKARVTAINNLLNAIKTANKLMAKSAKKIKARRSARPAAKKKK